MATATELQERIRAMVREWVAEQAPPEARPGVPLFTVLEDSAIAMGDAIMQEVMEEELARLAEQSSECPQCGQRGLKKGERRRVIQARRGKVEFTEPEFYCPRCRRAFFPSLGSAEPGRGLRL
jgi:hypothetical protein